MSDIIVGIDPGVTGAIAVLAKHGTLIDVHDMPTISDKGGKQHVNPIELARILREAGGLVVRLEQVNAMPGRPNKPGEARRSMGATGAFNFGRNYGTIIGVVQALGMQLELVTPQSWKKAAGLVGTAKDYARTKAIALYPNAPLGLKKHIGRADAILIARYG